VSCGRRCAPILARLLGAPSLPSEYRPCSSAQTRVSVRSLRSRSGGFASRRLHSATTRRPYRAVPVGPSGGGGSELRSALRADPRSAPRCTVPALRVPTLLVGSNPRRRPRLRRVRAGSTPALPSGEKQQKGPLIRFGPRTLASGGGGSRTRVRDCFQKSFYVRRSL